MNKIKQEANKVVFPSGDIITSHTKTLSRENIAEFPDHSYINDVIKKERNKSGFLVPKIQNLFYCKKLCGMWNLGKLCKNYN